MPPLTIADLEPETTEKLRRLGALHGRSLPEEAKHILHEVPEAPEPMTGAELYRRIRSIVEPIGGIDVDMPLRGQVDSIESLSIARTSHFGECLLARQRSAAIAK